MLTDLGAGTIHQCDMCGVCVPSKPVSGETAIVFDERAARVGYRRQYQVIERMAKDEATGTWAKLAVDC